MSRIARDTWRVVEPYHQLAYRSPEATAAYAAIGLERPGLQYFGSRLAALGPVSLPVAVAVLYGFAPAYVARAVPEVWDVARAPAIVTARRNGADATLRRVLGDDVVGSDAMAEAASLARRAAESADLAGRPMAAAHAGLAWPAEPHLVVWHACTILREHRGDAHWAATSAADLDAVECHVLHAADGAMPEELLQRVSGWDDDAWAAATGRLRRRGLLVADELALTDAGRDVKLAVEHATDRAAARPLAAIGEEAVHRFQALLRPWTRAITEAGVIGAWKLREELWRDLPEPSPGPGPEPQPQ
jgi:hypothetical protein